jgi:hypothetical protein
MIDETCSEKTFPDDTLMDTPDFTISFDPALTPDQITAALAALADYYRACGGVGFLVDLVEEDQSTTNG